MTDQAAIREMQEWGYYLLPQFHSNSPGYSGLLVTMRENRTGMRFNPEAMRVQILDPTGYVYSTTLGIRPALYGARPVCAGRVVLADEKGREEEFFVYGGLLESVLQPGETTYTLRSPAPVLQLAGHAFEQELIDQLATETEVMLARWHAHWGADDDGFAQRLCQVDTLHLYVAIVDAILTEYDHSQALRDDFPEFYLMLAVERAWLKQSNRWPTTPPTLAALLSPNGAHRRSRPL